jgi:hypothetical protein
MKSIFTLLLATVFTSAFARNEGRLTISIVSNKNFQVFVDGRQYRDEENTFVVNNIQSGNHTVQVYRQTGNNSNGNGYGRNRNNSRGELIYSSTVYVRPSYHVDVVINRFGKALVDEKMLTNRNGRWEDDEDEWNNDGYNNSYGKAMSDYDFSQLVQRLRNQWFGRLGNAKDAINSNYFNTSQARQLLDVFTSESDKLELAKLFYAKIVDRQNFKQLYDLFSYASQAELDRYIRDFRY